MDLVLMLLLAAQAASPAVAEVAAAGEDKVMCRLVQEPQSRIPSRVCRKQSEWEEMAKETQEELRSSRHQRTAGGLDKSD